MNIERDNCIACQSAYGPEGIAFTRQKQDGYGDVKLYTIFIDEIDSDGENLFVNYVLGRYNDFFKAGQDIYLNSYLGAYEEYSHYESLAPGNNYLTPTYYLIDFTEGAPSYTSKSGISEAIQSIEHSDDLVDAYYHVGKYGATSWCSTL